MNFCISNQKGKTEIMEREIFFSGSGVSPLPLRGIPTFGRNRALHQTQRFTHQSTREV